jgi:hypothetical protein
MLRDDDLATRTVGALTKEFGEGTQGADACARAVGVSQRTAQNWWRGLVHGMNWRNVLTLLRRSDVLLEEFVITPEREYWFTEKFRPRHLSRLLGIADDEGAKILMTIVKEASGARKAAAIVGSDAGPWVEKLDGLAILADSLRSEAA